MSSNKTYDNVKISRNSPDFLISLKDVACFLSKDLHSVKFYNNVSLRYFKKYEYAEMIFSTEGYVADISGGVHSRDPFNILSKFFGSKAFNIQFHMNVRDKSGFGDHHEITVFIEKEILIKYKEYFEELGTSLMAVNTFNL